MKKYQIDSSQVYLVREINCFSNSHSLSDPSLKAAYNASKLAMKNLILMNGSCYELISQITLHSS